MRVESAHRVEAGAIEWVRGIEVERRRETVEMKETAKRERERERDP